MFFLKKKTIPFKDLIPANYVDIHSHLLPGIDDGSKNIYDTTKLITELKEIGINNFITTPHIMEDVWPNTTERVQTKLVETKNLLSTFKIDGISIRAGAEYMVDNLFLKRLMAKDILCLKDNFVLIEMSIFHPRLNILDVLFEIKLAGYQPILAHPERYSYYHNKFDRYTELKNAGCDFQLNLLSLFNYYGKEVKDASLKLLEAGLIDFTGTDVHNTIQIERLKNNVPKKWEGILTSPLKNNVIFN